MLLVSYVDVAQMRREALARFYANLANHALVPLALLDVAEGPSPSPADRPPAVTDPTLLNRYFFSKVISNN
jgi:hypothetical protein